ncbi:hypothetical protein MKX03_003363, partial [Papaver bracteatum]
MPDRKQAFWKTTVYGLRVKGASLLADVFVRSALLYFNGTYGYMTTARKFLEEMPKRAYSGISYKSIRKYGISLNYITIVSILGYCSALNDLLKVGAYIVLMGFGKDDYVKNPLLTMYAKCGDFASNSFIFNEFSSKND